METLDSAGRSRRHWEQASLVTAPHSPSLSRGTKEGLKPCFPKFLSEVPAEAAEQMEEVKHHLGSWAWREEFVTPSYTSWCVLLFIQRINKSIQWHNTFTQSWEKDTVVAFNLLLKHKICFYRLAVTDRSHPQTPRILSRQRGLTQTPSHFAEGENLGDRNSLPPHAIYLTSCYYRGCFLHNLLVYSHSADQDTLT